LFEADLTAEERTLLVNGLHEWGGPARPTPDVARLLGFRDVEDLLLEGGEIARQIRGRDPFCAADWRRALFATEIVFRAAIGGGNACCERYGS